MYKPSFRLSIGQSVASMLAFVSSMEVLPMYRQRITTKRVKTNKEHQPHIGKKQSMPGKGQFLEYRRLEARNLASGKW